MDYVDPTTHSAGITTIDGKHFKECSFTYGQYGVSFESGYGYNMIKGFIPWGNLSRITQSGSN